MSSAVKLQEVRLKNIRVTQDTITAQLVDGLIISVPLAWSWRLSEATPKQRANFRIIGEGHGVHWSDIDEDISTEGAVRFAVSGRFTPNAAQRRFESAWRGSFSFLNEREELLSFNACIRGLPCSTRGFKSWTGFISPAEVKVAQTGRPANIRAADINNALFIIVLSR
jgi:uncharacterized protein DUF2442